MHGWISWKSLSEGYKNKVALRISARHSQVSKSVPGCGDFLFWFFFGGGVHPLIL